MQSRIIRYAAAAGAALSLGAVVGTPARADKLPTGNGCVAGKDVASQANPAGGGNLVNNGTCSFTATINGGFAAASTSYAVAVYDTADPATRHVIANYTSENRQTIKPGSPVPNLPAPAPCFIPAFKKGNFVVVRANQGAVWAGDFKDGFRFSCNGVD
jgi:hypothetical protein